MEPMKRIGLALGGGGAKGFAHIPVLEVFDELDIRPRCIAGTSVGAIIGALYASGHKAADLRAMLDPLIMSPQKSSMKTLFRSKDLIGFLQFIDPEFSLKPKGLIKGDKLLGFLYEQLQVDTFRELKIPLKVIAADFWRKEQVVFESGELLPALRASMALPYLFTPVEKDGRVLVDGGLVNNVPHDQLSPKCDLRIAVDVMGRKNGSMTKIPSPRDAVFHTYTVMMNAMTREKLINHPVDLYLQPPIVDIDMLDFHKAETAYQQGLQIKDDFKRQLERLLADKKPRGGWFGKKQPGSGN
jgi:NTE family protein